MGSNAEVVEKAYAAFAAGDIAGILDLLDDHVEWSAPATLPQGGTFTGKDGALKFFEGIGGTWDSLRVEAEAVGGLGSNLVVGVVRGWGKLRRGEAAQYGAVHVFTVDRGKITRFREYVDLDEAL
jgi:ketosteroid isomerase-like protein